MLSISKSQQPLSALDAPRRRRKRRIPPNLVLAEVVALCLLGMFIHATDILGDHLFDNFAVLFLGMIAVSTLAVWFLFFSPWLAVAPAGACRCCVGRLAFCRAVSDRAAQW